MAETIQSYSVFIGSPGDVVSERLIIPSIIKELNQIYQEDNIHIRSIKWEDDSRPGIGDDAQDVINKQISNSYDVFVGIMWAKVGTQTGRSLSGTIEEFERAYERYKKNNDSVKILFYFNVSVPSKILSDIDPIQLNAVKEFKSRLNHLGIKYHEYSELEDFKEKIRLHINKEIRVLESKRKSKQILLSDEKLESVLIEKRKKAVQDDDMFAQFAYAISHQFRSPLRSITSYAKLIMGKYGNTLDTEVKEYLEFIVESATRTTKMYDDFLDYYRVAVYNDFSDKTDVEKIIQDSYLFTLRNFEHVNISIHVYHIPPIMASKYLLDLFFKELFNNSAKYRNGDSIGINLKYDQDSEFHNFQFRDDGIGFDNIFADRLFQPFRRLHDQSQYPGTGLGLATCKIIIEKHGGKIRLESNVDVGVTVFFSISKNIKVTES